MLFASCDDVVVPLAVPAIRGVPTRGHSMISSQTVEIATLTLFSESLLIGRDHGLGTRGVFDSKCTPPSSPSHLLPRLLIGLFLTPPPPLRLHVNAGKDTGK
jgi:hypothetical protein